MTLRKWVPLGQPLQPQPWGKCGASPVLRLSALGPPAVPADASSRQVSAATPLCRLKCWSCSLGGCAPHVPDLCVWFAGGFSVCVSFEQH